MGFQMLESELEAGSSSVVSSDDTVLGLLGPGGDLGNGAQWSSVSEIAGDTFETGHSRMRPACSRSITSLRLCRRPRFRTDREAFCNSNSRSPPAHDRLQFPRNSI